MLTSTARLAESKPGNLRTHQHVAEHPLSGIVGSRTCCDHQREQVFFAGVAGPCEGR
jgi:hypothetical protein